MKRMIENGMIRYVLLTVVAVLFSSVMFSGAVYGKDKLEIAQVERGLLPPVVIEGEKPWTLLERMRFHKVPGVSIAVIKDFKIDWARGYGYTDVMTRAPVTAETLFQAASISKPVAAAAALRLVQEGKLKLDKNINAFLKSWKLPENSFTKETPVTIAHILTHTGGLTVHGFRGYSSVDKVPTLLQLLDGKAPANSAPIRVDIAPGSRTRYSGGGYSILQQMLIDTTGKTFPDYLDESVLKPFGMTHSTYRQPLPAEKAKQAAAAHLASGLPLPGKWHTYPEMAAAGLWTTPEDLGRFVIGLQLALQNKSDKVLSGKMAKEMTTRGAMGPFGLGVVLNQRDGNLYFEHSGGNEGFRCHMIGHGTKGYGAVIMTNSDNGSNLYAEILRGIARIYDWGGMQPDVKKVVEVDAAKLKKLTGKYAVDSDHLMEITEENGKLFGRVTSGEKARLFPISDTQFIRKDQGGVYEFVFDKKSGAVTQIDVSRNRGSRTYSRKGDDYSVPLELLLNGQIPQALEGYRNIKKNNPSDGNIQGMRLLFLTEELIGKGKLPAALTLLHLTAELQPETVKQMYSTLNNEIRMMMRSPALPDGVKKQIKDSYNQMLKKLRLKELE